LLPSVSLSPIATRLDLPGDPHAASATAQIAPAGAVYTLTGWRLETLRARAGGPAVADLASGAVFEIEGGEAVTAAPELARVTLNIATAHTDAVGSVHGWRHVYASHLDREGAL
jgi:hypothetical protein